MSAAPKNPGRILIVDDDADARDILSRLLATHGYSCVTAESGPRMLEILKSDVIDVILLDVMMPGMDGLQVCEKLREDERLRSIPVILLTARDDLATRAQGMALGVSEYLTKPINRVELFSRIRAQLHSREVGRQLEQTAASLKTTDKG